METNSVDYVAPSEGHEVRSARIAERERVSAINVTAGKLGLPDAALRAIDEDWSVERFRNFAIDAAATRQDQNATNYVASAVDNPAGQHHTYAQPATADAKGTNATRCLIALAAVKGDKRAAADFISRTYGPAGNVAARALSTSIGSSGGFLVPADMAAGVIELLRPKSAVMSLGPRIVPMPNGNMSMPRIDAGAMASYGGENQPIQASQPQFGMIQMSAKKLTALVPISNDMIKFPSVSTDGVVRDDLIKSIAVRADLAFIRGTGGQFSPRGLRSFAADASLGGSNVIASTTLVNLDSITSDLGNLELALEQANVGMEKPGYIFSPRTKKYLKNLRDGLGNLVYAAEMSRGLLRGIPFRSTTLVPNNLPGLLADNTTATTDATEVYLADFAEVLIGEANGIEIEAFNGGAYVDSNGTLQSGISNDQTVIRAIVQHDMDMRHLQAAAVLTGVRWF